MALDTGKKITRRKWDVIPMPELVIARVNALGKDEPELFTFTDRHGRLVGDADTTGVSDDSEPVDDDVEFPGVEPVIDDNIEIPGVDGEEGSEDPAPQIEINDDLEISSDPNPIQVETVQEETAQHLAPAIEPVQLPEPRRSSRVKKETSQAGICSEHDRF